MEPIKTKSAFESAGAQARSSIVGEFLFFLKQNKKWWLLPMLIVIALLGMLVFLAGTGLAPFVYPFF